ncbi:prolyl aminopeptidase [Trebouxia sp. C0010 RCD-2024]
MHICTGVDRPSVNWHVCSQARLLHTDALRCHDRRSLRQTCRCSCSASTSEGSAENYQLPSYQSGNATRCIHSAKRALKRAFRHDRGQHSRSPECCVAAPVSCKHSRPSRNSAANLCFLLTAAILPGRGFADLGQNYVFMAGFWGWFLAQTCKIFTKRWRKGVWDLKAIVDSGGMPSSHSALCSAVTTATALEFGLGSSLFAVSLAFSLIVMYDAAGVRRHAGKQAEVLNILLEDLLEGHAVSETKLKEVLGHTPIQVCVGALLGVLVGVFFPIPAPIMVA